MQHDMVTDNQNGAAFRADLNNALQALVSNGSGATAPSTTYAYMFWADTSAGLLKQRNAANTAWSSIGIIGQDNLGLLPKAGGAMTGIHQLDESSSIASASTVDLGSATGNSVSVTHSSGTIAISSFGGATSLQAGTVMDIKFSISGGTLTLTHNATSLDIPGAANLTLANKDKIRVRKTSDTNAYWEIIDVTKSDGSPLVSSPDASTTVKGIQRNATAAEARAGSVSNASITPDVLAAAVPGIGQTLQNLTASRAFNTTYTNNTGQMITVTVYATSASGTTGAQAVFALSINGAGLGNIGSANAGQSTTTFSFTVADGETYNVSSGGTSPSLSLWLERRK